ncbi:MAG: PriCT-2 domain-containing protein [Hydrogenophaga sp.]|uniref:PriCT-2 domain-containing protein n=1 Tax=Hydrogenophaga sp. TaxID=1904254 RepID=UPI002637F0B8|nr:PriCT-2 domain-containing protein [Hydrogenophaga sp.]MCV0439305.1 PriCT-2 domain-containing protein [Hydrogenophaga sp.]
MHEAQKGRHPGGALPVAESGVGAPQTSPQVVAMSTLAYMKLAQRWLCWALVPDSEGGKAKKIPYYVDGTPRGKTDTPEDWAKLASYAEACAAVRESNGRFISAAFALGPDGSGCCWQGVDFDDVDDNNLGDLVMLAPGYIEMSPSGRGAHAIGYGRTFPTLGSNKSGIEAYSSGRYFTFTERMIRDSALVCLADYVTQSLLPRHAVMRAQHCADVRDVFVPPRLVSELRSALRHMPSDGYQIWISMGMALHELGDVGRGIWLDWSSMSTKFDPSIAARTWESFKPDNTGYRAVFAEAQRQGWVNPASNAAQIEKSAAHGGFTFQFARAGMSVLQIDYLIDPWLPRATVVGCYGRGEAGKSSWTAQICAEASSSVSTLWISSEERKDHILQRHTSCSGEDGTLAVIDVIPIAVDPKTGKAASTAFNIYDHLEPALIDLMRNTEARRDRPLGIVVLDAVVALVSWARGESANDDAAVKRLVGFLCDLAERYGICFVMLGHLNKNTGNENIADAVMGSAAWTNSVRLAYMFVKDTESEGYEGFVRTVKSNTGTHFGATYRTIPVYTLRQRPDGRDDVLCGARMVTSIVWGELALREMMASDSDPLLKKLEKRREKIQAALDGVLQALRFHPSTTRKVVETQIGDKVSRRHWQEVDRLLALHHGVQMQNDPHNERRYNRPQSLT